MLSTRWPSFGDVWTEMNRLQHEMNRVFQRLGHGTGLRQVTATYPALNLWQDEGNLYVEAELPGMELDELEIFATGNEQLTIKGKRDTSSAQPGTWHRRERGYGEFSRTLTLPQGVDPDKIEAEFKHGVLCVTLPKREEVKPRRIAVKAD
jgi:HSP20 family protein